MIIKKILEDYIQFIRNFEKLMIEEYKLKQNPFFNAGILFDRKGHINGYQYSYHGAGCTLQKDGIICEYDFVPLKGKEIEFSLWKFSEFIRTHPDYKDYNISETLEIELLKLIDEKVLSWLEIEGRIYKIYQIL